MLSLALAGQLKAFGLEWEPQLHDFFAIPDREMDEYRFVLTDVMAYVELFRGSPMVTFHGTAEWALDYILQTEAVWLPTESQLRRRLAQQATEVTLVQTPAGYECRCQFAGQPLSFTAADASDAYASALLHILMQQAADPGTN